MFYAIEVSQARKIYKRQASETECMIILARGATMVGLFSTGFLN